MTAPMPQPLGLESLAVVADILDHHELGAAAATVRGAANALVAVTAELEQVRQSLTDAPHGWACDFNFIPGLDRLADDAECSCWKRDC